MTLGLNGAALRFYYDLEGDERRRFYGTLWCFFALFPALTLVFVELLGRKLFNQLFVQVSYSPYLRLALWTSYLTVVFMTLPREFFKASERAVIYAGLNIGQFLLVTGMTIWLVVGLKKGAEGALWARLAGVAGIGLVSMLVLRKHVCFSFNSRLLKQALIYGLPLLPHFLAHWGLSASDRVILQKYVSLTDVGVYSVGYTIGSAMLLFVVAGNNAMIPLFGKLKSESSVEVAKLMKVVTYYVLAITFIGLCISLFSKEIIYLLTPPFYHRAVFVIPWVVLGYFFMGLYVLPMNTFILIIADTKKVGIYTTGAAVTNIGLNLWLIPKYGMVAAAVTTAIAYFVLFLTISFFAHKRRSLPYEYYRISKILIVAFMTFVVGWYFAPNSIGAGIAVKTALLASFPFELWLVGFLIKGEHLAIQKLIKQSLRI